jgi:hypothetical protein
LQFLDAAGEQIVSIGNYVYDDWKSGDLNGASGERLIGFEISLGGYDKNVIKGLRFVYMDMLGLTN